MLIDRRTFFLTAAAGLSVEFSGARACAGATASAFARQPIVAAVYDSRCARALLFAEAFRRRGAAAFAIEGDSTGLWYGELGELILGTGGSVAGLTTRANFVIARSRGRELSLRGVFEEPLRVGEPSRTACAHRAPSRAPIHLTAWLLESRSRDLRVAQS